MHKVKREYLPNLLLPESQVEWQEVESLLHSKGPEKKDFQPKK
jgi:hypothetical protein